MALVKRNKMWSTDFSVNGQRYRQSLHTSDWREAQQREKALIADATIGRLTPSGQQFVRLAFSEAAARYLQSRTLELSERSLKKERQLLVQPSRHFGSTPVAKITTDMLIAYRESRSITGVANAYLNMETGAIRRILKRAKRWHLIADDFRPLKERRDIGRALSEEEKNRLLRFAAMRPEWVGVRFAVVLALNTTMRGCEIKGLRWRDVDLLDQTVTIRRSKTAAGARVIPLNGDALNVIVQLYKRAQGIGGDSSEHFVFPSCENDRIDPTRPQRTWRTAWRKLTRSIECPACGVLQNPSEHCIAANCGTDLKNVKSSLSGLRFHDLRHHAITELAESADSDQVIMSIAGHVSQKMLAHYSHVRLSAKRKALDALNTSGKAEGYDTNNGTNGPARLIQRPQVIETNGRPVRARTADLHRVKVAL